MKLGALLITCLFSGCLSLGCIASRAETKFGAGTLGSWKFYDSKDNDIEIEELTINPETKTGTLKGFKIRNNASDPQTVFNETIMANVELNKVYGANAAAMFQEARQMMALASQTIATYGQQRNERAAIANAAPPNIVDQFGAVLPDIIQILAEVAGNKQPEAVRAKVLLDKLGIQDDTQ